MTAVYGLLRLTRPNTWGIAAIAVIAGAYTGPETIADWAPLIRAIAVAALFTAGGMVLNDAADVEIDRVNKSHRPIPSGRVSRPVALVWGVILLLTGLVILLPLSPACRWIGAGSLAAIIIYNLWGSRQPLIGNLIVAIVTGLAFLFGGLAVGHGWWSSIPAVLAFFFILGREIIKDLEDIEADRHRGLRTLPLAAGEAAARAVARLVFTILIIIVTIPAVVGWFSLVYLLAIIVGVGVPLLWLVVRLARPHEAASYKRIQMFLKWDMLAGLLSILIG